MSRHEGVSCDCCMRSNFATLRYKCLVCYDYDLCATCYHSGAVSAQHTVDHAVQCIPTQADCSDLFYGGAGGTMSSAPQHQSFTCPHCARMGFTLALLQEHVRTTHADTLTTEVVCPICASQSGGDPNHVTDDLATHIALVHRTTSAELDDEHLGGVRQVRRLTHPVRATNFGTRPPRGAAIMQLLEPAVRSAPLTAAPAVAQSRSNPVDPISELLSQLSSMRNRAVAAHELTMTSHLHQLEMQLATTKQQLERLPLRQMEVIRLNTTAAQPAKVAAGAGTSETSKSTTAPTTAGTPAAAAAGVAKGGSGESSGCRAASQFLLSRRDVSAPSELDRQKDEKARANRSAFLQELLMSFLSEETPSDPLGLIDLSSQVVPSTAVNLTLDLANTPAAVGTRLVSDSLTNGMPHRDSPLENGDESNCTALGDAATNGATSEAVCCSNERPGSGMRTKAESAGAKHKRCATAAAAAPIDVEAA